MIPTPEQLVKLPKWAQEHIADLTRRREAAVRALNASQDGQTPSEFFYDDYIFVEDKGTDYRHYIQTHKMTVARNGVQVNILLRQDDPGIELSFSTVDHATAQVAMVAMAFNKICIVPSDKLK